MTVTVGPVLDALWDCGNKGAAEPTVLDELFRMVGHFLEAADGMSLLQDSLCA